MSRRQPSDVLVVDSNILLSAILGRAGTSVLHEVRAARVLICTPRTVDEVRGVLQEPQHQRHSALADVVLAIAAVQPLEHFSDRLELAGLCLRNAAASANGSTTDNHIVALAWAAAADIWSHDRDFAGTGCPSWSTRNLRHALAG